MTPLALLRGGQVLHSDGTSSIADVLIDGGRISRIEPAVAPPDGAELIDLTGLTLAPGFVDVHVHGGGGFSLITSDPEEVRSFARWVVSRGVTSFLATICTDTVERGIACVEALSQLVGKTEGANLLGLNLEGPFVSPQRPGALPRAWLKAPDKALFDRLLEAANGTLRVMTIAPELPGALVIVSAARDAGVAVSVGHTDATFDQALAGFEAGATHVTHAFNTMRPLHHRDPGPLGAALRSPDVTVEVIADGVHLHPATVGLLIEAFGERRVALITDAVSPAGLDAGTFRIGGQEARLEDGSIRLPDGTIAGSATTMDTVVRNAVRWGLADLPAAVRMASTTPAGIVGQPTKGAIAAGCDGDLVALTADLNVAKTWVGGRLVYSRE